MEARASWPLLVIALVLAGCSAPEAPAATGGGEPLDNALAPPLTPAAGGGAPGAAPMWSVGDAWAITARGVGAEERAFLVVTAASGSEYTLSTTSEQMAGFDAMYDVSYVGRIRAADLAGHQNGEPVKYFDFPLEDGKTWTAKWDGLDVALSATATPAGFAISGLVDGEPYVEYDFSPELKWWSHIHFVQGDYGFTVERLDTAWTGEVKAAAASVVHEGEPAAPVLSGASGAFTVSEGQTFVMATLVGGGTQWGRAFALVDPAGQPYPTTTINNWDSELMGPRHEWQQEQLPPTPGEWRIVSQGMHDPTGGFWLTVHEVAVSTVAFP